MNRYREYAINGFNNFGPIFGNDIFIKDNCNREKSCSIENDGTEGYECHTIHQKSLFVNTAGPDYTNYFTVLDYEVFTR